MLDIYWVQAYFETDLPAGCGQQLCSGIGKHMKVFHKQLILLLLFLGLIMGTAGYFAYSGFSEIFRELTIDSAQLAGSRFQDDIDEMLQKQKFGGRWVADYAEPIREYFLVEKENLNSLHDFYLISADSQVVFQLNRSNGEALDLPGSGQLSQSIGKNPSLFDWTASGRHVISWRPLDSQLTAVLVMDAWGNIQDEVGSLTIQLYLVVFGTILGVMFLAMLTSRIVKSPMKLVDRAMINIDKRKYGYRVKAKRDDEFYDIFQKVNAALTRLEQLDSVQRTAVQRKNSLLRELKTISRFMDIMAHEVKNPLHALVINIDVLKTKIEKGRPKTDSIKHIDIIERELDHLREVINGFLSYVRPGVPQKERIELNALVKDVCQMAEAESEKAGVRIESRLGKGLRDISVDRGQLQQALHNVLINALHASSQDSKVIVRTWSKANKVLLAVKDAGAGISKEELKRIFDLYFTTKKDGSGIGLPVTRKIIESNGGTMQLESKVDKGTTVTFSFNAI